jgi:probable HAF family extracellular repeat protein
MVMRHTLPLGALRAFALAATLLLLQTSCMDGPEVTSPSLLEQSTPTTSLDVCAELGPVEEEDCPVVTVTDIGSAIETDWSEALYVNNRGQIAGFYSDPIVGSVRGFFWEDGVLTRLGTLGGTGGGWPTGLNNRGQVVGFSYNADELERAFLWQSGVMRDLGTLGGFGSVAQAVNDHGVVVGYADTPNGELHAFRWENGVMTDLGGPTFVNRVFINNSGVISGWGYFEGDAVALRAFRWEDGVFTRLPMEEPQPEWLDQVVAGMNSRGQILGRTPALTIWRGDKTTTFPEWPAVLAIGINDAGQVLFADREAYLMDAAEVTPLGTRNGHPLEARALNARGQVAANAFMPDGNARAVRWERGKLVNLGALDGVASVANGINDAGIVVGYVQTADPRNRAVMWRVSPRRGGEAP